MKEAEDTKHPLDSKTVQFNTISAAFIPAIWPFLPESFRHHDYAIAAISGWYTIGNVVLRFLTSEAISWRAEKTEK